ncbi:hypothetical protein RchiOBHm_Chr1g0356521 [Rosa chinensis]|uniref:Uncharacterized protein n=1 Tax=Rosa chinensis TaxID=74649 RepID=A0A2P6SHP9_ROSCH|nr:hypothetical protein RchiOBHm_Chr1g0356521 [Rosa chinensis]
MFMKLLMLGLLFESCGIDEALWWNSEKNIENGLEVGGSVLEEDMNMGGWFREKRG